VSTVRTVENRTQTDLDLSKVPKMATIDYMTHCVTSIEREVVQWLGINPLELMMEASYKKTLTTSEVLVPTERNITIEETLMNVNNCEWSDEVLEIVKRGGILSRYPLLMLLKNKLTIGMIMRILNYLGIEARRDLAFEVALGMPTNGNVVTSYVPWSDVNRVVIGNRGRRVVRTLHQYFI